MQTKITNLGDLRKWLNDQPDDNIIFIKDNVIYSIQEAMTVSTLKENLDVDSFDDNIIIKNPSTNILKITNNFHVILSSDVQVFTDGYDENNNIKYLYYDYSDSCIIE